MNKQERKLKGIYKFKKRLENNGLTPKEIFKLESKGIKLNLNCYRTTGKPCSCISCSPGKLEEKYKYKVKHKGKINTDE